MSPYFYLPCFHVLNSALLFEKYSDYPCLHRRSLVLVEEGHATESNRRLSTKVVIISVCGNKFGVQMTIYFQCLVCNQVT